MSAVAEFPQKLKSSDTTPSAMVMGYTATIEMVERHGLYSINTHTGQRSAHLAEGVLIQLNIGDYILYIETDQGLFITQLLKRKEQEAPITLYNDKGMEYVAPKLSFKALEEMELLSVNKLSLTASHILLGAGQTLLQQANHFLQKAKDFSLTTKNLMRLSGRQQVITAEDDMRIDAKRINMG